MERTVSTLKNLTAHGRCVTCLLSSTRLRHLKMVLLPLCEDGCGYVPAGYVDMSTQPRTTRRSGGKYPGVLMKPCR